ncbi:MAG: hypothetical protein AAF710_09370 [Planctomycetota bacterium]
MAGITTRIPRWRIAWQQADVSYARSQAKARPSRQRTTFTRLESGSSYFDSWA